MLEGRDEGEDLPLETMQDRLRAQSGEDGGRGWTDATVRLSHLLKVRIGHHSHPLVVTWPPGHCFMLRSPIKPPWCLICLQRSNAAPRCGPACAI